jgi:hypothetical protein
MRPCLLSSPTLSLNQMSSLRRSVIADIQRLKLRRRIRRTLIIHKSRLNVILKIKEEKGTESLETYVKSTWLIISRQRRIDTEKRYRNIL